MQNDDDDNDADDIFKDDSFVSWCCNWSATGTELTFSTPKLDL